MNTKRFAFALAAVALIALPAIASAAKVPTYYQYGGKCNKQKICQQSAYTNSKNTQLISFYVGAKCEKSDSTFSIQLLNAVKINSKHKFTFTGTANNFDKGDTDSSGATVTVKGKVSKKSKVSGTWSADKTSAGCTKAKTGSFSMKYKGAVHGG